MRIIRFILGEHQIRRKKVFLAVALDQTRGLILAGKALPIDVGFANDNAISVNNSCPRPRINERKPRLIQVSDANQRSNLTLGLDAYRLPRHVFWHELEPQKKLN
jgi:hypothetical protein